MKGVGWLMVGVFAVAPLAAWAEMPPQPNDAASLVVDGVVREAFQSVRSRMVDHVFLIEVRSAKLGSKPQLPYAGPLPKPGDAIYVHAFQRRPDAPQIPGPVGYRSLPAEGSVIVAYLYPHEGSGWQFAYPLGFEAKGRVASDDLGPLTAEPAGSTLLSGAAGINNGGAVQPRRQLGVQATPVVVADERGLQITRVVPGSAAARAGLVSGDVILKAAGRATAELNALTDQVVNSGPRLPLFVRRAATGNHEVVEIDFAPAR